MAKRAYVKKSERRQSDALHAAEVRACCPTSMMEPHLPACERTRKCRTKLGYTTREVAASVARRLSPDRGLMTVYRCPDCRLHHVGHPMTEGEGL